MTDHEDDNWVHISVAIQQSIDHVREQHRLWLAAKAHLIRSLGKEGAAEWLEFSAAQMRIEARRDVIELRPTQEFRP